MIILGVILLVIGYFTALHILYTVGAIVLVIGLVFLLMGQFGTFGGGPGVGGRRWWF